VGIDAQERLGSREWRHGAPPDGSIVRRLPRFVAGARAIASGRLDERVRGAQA